MTDYNRLNDIFRPENTSIFSENTSSIDQTWGYQARSNPFLQKAERVATFAIGDLYRITGHPGWDSSYRDAFPIGTVVRITVANGQHAATAERVTPRPGPQSLTIRPEYAEKVC